jgi:hypothetical protein
MSVELPPILEKIATTARDQGVFASVEAKETDLHCAAKDCESEAGYRIGLDDGRLWVSFVTPDRWLSESVEADLMHTGDKLEELIEEELVDLEIEVSQPIVCEHYRSDDRVFTFRTPVPVELEKTEAAEIARVSSGYLLAYEACFRELGDVVADDEDD